MDIIKILTSINKIGLAAFFLTLGFLIYQIYQIRSENEAKPDIKMPKFQESAADFSRNFGSAKPGTGKSLLLIKLGLGVAILLLIFLTFQIFSNKKVKNLQTQVFITATPIINFATSKGIRIFNADFNHISDEKLGKIKPGDKIIIGVETIPNLKIIKGRIRVNRDVWIDEDIVKNFNAPNNVFYKKYLIASNESELKIEAQLYSETDGWLGQ